MTFSTFASPGVSLQGGGGGGGGGTPGGSNTQIQYNNSGAFAGASGLTTNGTELTIASGTKTADAPVLNMSQTWNNGAVTFTGLKFNVVSDTSAASSLLMDLQVGGTSRVSVGKAGSITIPLGTSAGYSFTGGTVSLYAASNALNIYSGALVTLVNAASSFGWIDLFLTRRAAANPRFGAADAAAPVAQTLSVQSVVAGTTNTAGANLTITGSQGTGTGAGGSIIFQVAPAGSSGSAQNALATALTIDSAGITTATALKVAESSGRIYLGGNAGGTGTGFWANGGTAIFFTFNGSQTLNLNSTGPQVSNSGSFSWSSAATGAGTADLILARDAANTLALRNGANAQEFRVYNTTDGTNSEFGSIKWVSNILSIGPAIAGTGTQREFSITRGGSTYMTTTSGSMSFPVNVSMSGELAIAAGDPYRWSTRSRMTSPADGIVAFNANTAANGSALQLTEMTAPAAPAANGVRIYAVDNGSGKTQLMALFATGAAQQIAIEP